MTLDTSIVILTLQQIGRGIKKIGQSRETDNIGYTRRRQTKQKTQHNVDTTIRKQTQIM